MAEYKVDAERLTTSANTIKSQGEQLLMAIEKIKQEIAGTESFWTGSAKGKYQGVMEGWQGTATNAHSLLRDTMDKLTAAATLYGETEGSNASKFSG